MNTFNFLTFPLQNISLKDALSKGDFEKRKNAHCHLTVSLPLTLCIRELVL